VSPRASTTGPIGIGVRAALIFAPLCGAVAAFATLDPMATVLGTAGGGLVAGVFFGVAARLGERGATEERE